MNTLILCLALVGWNEARSLPIDAQVAAQKVLFNRAHANHTHPCEELKKQDQFSWVTAENVKEPRFRRFKNNIEWCQWIINVQIAKRISLFEIRGITPKHQFFNHVSLGRRYSTDAKVKRIGSMIYY